MKCQQVRIYSSPYLDSELDPTTTYEVARHLEICPACAQLFKGEEELEGAIGERLRQPQGDEQQLIERVLSRVLAQRSRQVDRRALVLAACLFLVFSLFAYRLITSESDRATDLIAMVAEDHRRTINGEITPELLTEDPVAVASFFRGKLAGPTGSFPAGEEWEVEGARVCRYRDMSVGFVTLRYHGIPVSVVDVPVEAEGSTGPGFSLTPDDRCYELAGGRGILRRTPFGLRVAFGDIPMSKLEEVVRAAP